jgi:hypothetical protein
MNCKRCGGDKVEDIYVNCEKCRQHNRDLYKKRKTTNKNSSLIKAHITEMTMLTLTMMGIINNIITTPQKNNEVFYKKETIKNDLISSCPICLDDIACDEVIYEMDCKHKFHTHCILLNSATSNLCPVCRSAIYKKPEDTDILVSCDELIGRIMYNVDNIFEII